MTISNTKTQEKYQGNGSTVQWSIPFAFNSKDDLEIYVISSDGTISRVTEDYAIDAVSKVLYYPLQNNGASPLPSGKTLLIRRNTPILQQVNFDAQSDIPKSVLENSYDKATMIAQDLAEQIGRAVKFPLGTTNGQTDAGAYLSTISSAVTTAQSAASAAQSAASSAAAEVQSSINSYTDSAVHAEQVAREAADAAKLDISAASSTYLSQDNASSTYLSKSDAQSSYLTKSDASSTYLTQSNASAMYLTQINAGGIYLSQSAAASTYLAQSDASSTYLAQGVAVSTYVPLTQKAAAGGVASLDSSALIPNSQIPTIDGGNANA